MTDARYRKLYPRIWRHAGFRSLDHIDRLVTLYVLTGPQTNRIGCFVLSPGAASEDLSLSGSGTFLKRLANVCGTFGWTFHEPSRVMLVRSWWEWNRPENANVLKGALKDAAELPETPVYADLYECSRNVCQTLGVTFPERLGKRSPIQEQDQEQEQQQDQEQEPVPSSSADDGFDAFWAVYPRKVGKGLCRKLWEIVKPTPERQDAILAAVARQRECAQWLKDGGQYIPHPATWLRQGRWDDEACVDVPQACVAALPVSADFGWCRHEPRCGTRAGHEIKLSRGELETTT